MEVQGVGYRVFVTGKTLLKIPKNQENFKIFTSLNLREDGVELYGFLSFAELELFETLNNISGIGPKTALDLSTFDSLEKLKTALEKDGVKIKGLGTKKLQKLTLEITGKIKESGDHKIGTSLSEEAVEALVSLGFSAKEAKQALGRFPQDMSSKEKVREALKMLGARG